MSATTTWLVVLVAGAGCYLLRISLVALLRGRDPSPAAIRIAEHVMPAAFASLAAVALFHTAAAGASQAVVPSLGAAVTAVVAVRTGNSNVALGAGLATAALATALPVI